MHCFRQQILPAEVLFQTTHGAYGEVGDLCRAMADDGKTQLLDPRFAQSVPVGHFRFEIFLPSRDHADLRRQYWVAYAWPEDDDAGDWEFAVTQTGNVWGRKIPAGTVASTPAWNELSGTTSWSGTASAPGWQPVRRMDDDDD